MHDVPYSATAQILSGVNIHPRRAFKAHMVYKEGLTWDEAAATWEEALGDTSVLQEEISDGEITLAVNRHKMVLGERGAMRASTLRQQNTFDESDPDASQTQLAKAVRTGYGEGVSTVVKRLLN